MEGNRIRRADLSLAAWSEVWSSWQSMETVPHDIFGSRDLEYVSPTKATKVVLHWKGEIRYGPPYYTAQILEQKPFSGNVLQRWEGSKDRFFECPAGLALSPWSPGGERVVLEEITDRKSYKVQITLLIKEPSGSWSEMSFFSEDRIPFGCHLSALGESIIVNSYQPRTEKQVVELLDVESGRRTMLLQTLRATRYQLSMDRTGRYMVAIGYGKSKNMALYLVYLNPFSGPFQIELKVHCSVEGMESGCILPGLSSGTFYLGSKELFLERSHSEPLSEFEAQWQQTRWAKLEIEGL